MTTAYIFDNPTVTIGTTPITVTCDLTRAEVTNSVNMVDTGTLCAPAQLPGKIDFTLELEGYQDYGQYGTAPAVDTLWQYLWDNMRQTVAVTIMPKNAAVGINNPKMSLDAVCVPGEFGGTRNEVAAFSVSLPVVGVPTLGITLTLEEMQAIDASRATHGLPALYESTSTSTSAPSESESVPA